MSSFIVAINFAFTYFNTMFVKIINENNIFNIYFNNTFWNIYGIEFVSRNSTLIYNNMPTGREKREVSTFNSPPGTNEIINQGFPVFSQVSLS